MESVTEQQRKLIALGITVLAFAMIGFGIRQANLTIKEPFLPKGSTEKLLSQNSQDRAIERLRARDTDGDGLSDYDELELYKSSPYLVDSDSDGVNDDEEIGQGADPNCPGAVDCYGAVTGRIETPEIPVSGAIPTPLKLPGNTTLQGVLPEDLSADAIRDLLISYGIPIEQLSGISDQELQVMYQKLYNEF